MTTRPRGAVLPWLHVREDGLTRIVRCLLEISIDGPRRGACRSTRRGDSLTLVRGARGAARDRERNYEGREPLLEREPETTPPT